MDQGLPLAEKRTGPLLRMMTTTYVRDKSDLHGDSFSPPARKSVTIAKQKPWNHGDSKIGVHLFPYDTRIDTNGYTFKYDWSIDTYCLHTHENPLGAWLRVDKRTVLTPGTEIKIGKDMIRAPEGDNMVSGFDYPNFFLSSIRIREMNPQRIEIETNRLTVFGENERLEDIDMQTFMFRTHASRKALEKPPNEDAKAIYLKGSRKVRGRATICEFVKDPAASTWELVVHTGDVYVRLENKGSHPLEIGHHICIGEASEVSIGDGSHAFAEVSLPWDEELSTD